MEALDAEIRRVAAQRQTWEKLSAQSKLEFIDKLMDLVKVYTDEFLQAAVQKRDFADSCGPPPRKKFCSGRSASNNDAATKEKGSNTATEEKGSNSATEETGGRETAEETPTEGGKQGRTTERPGEEQQEETSCQAAMGGAYDIVADKRKRGLAQLAAETSHVTHSVLLLATWLTVTRETYDSIVRTGKPPPPLGTESLQRPRPDLPADGVKRDLTLAKVAPKGVLFTTFMSNGSAYVAVDGPVEQSPVTDKPSNVVAILGPGNFDGPADILHCLFIDNSVCIYKPSPFSRRLLPVLKKIFAPLIENGFIYFLENDDREEAHFLLHHPLVTKWYMTGSVETANRILWNSPTPPSQLAQQQQQVQHDCKAVDQVELSPAGGNRKEGEKEGTGEGKKEQTTALVPQLNKSCILELGNCTPWIIAPGAWPERALHWHARSIAYAQLFNGGHICVHPQLIITSKRWPQRDQFLRLVRSYQEDVVYVGCFYPDYAERIQGARDKLVALGLKASDIEVRLPVPLSFKKPSTDVDYALFATGLPEDNFLAHEEAFAPICGEVPLDTPPTVVDFLPAAVEYVNTKVRGTLATSLSIRIASSADEKALQDAIINLKYGSIVINSAPQLFFTFPSLLWGCYPSSSLSNLQSGMSHFGNLDGYKRAVKSVVRSPFYNFSHLLLTPPTPKNVQHLHKVLMRVTRAFLDRRAGASWFTLASHLTKISAAFLANL